MSLRNDSVLAENSLVFAQCAVLFTDMYGERRIRVLNYSWKVVTKLFNYFKSSDVENVIQYKLRHSLTQVPARGSLAVKDQVMTELVDMLATYRNQCANQTNASQLVLPETLTLLPLYVNATLRQSALKLLANCKVDDKIAQVFQLLGMSMEQMSYLLYPRVYKVTDIGQSEAFAVASEETGLLKKPPCLPCRLGKLNPQDAYLFDDGQYLTVFVGQQCPQDFLESVFGYATSGELLESQTLPAFAPVEGNETADLLSSLLE